MRSNEILKRKARGTATGIMQMTSCNKKSPRIARGFFRNGREIDLLRNYYRHTNGAAFGGTDAHDVLTSCQTTDRYFHIMLPRGCARTVDAANHTTCHVRHIHMHVGCILKREANGGR